MQYRVGIGLNRIPGSLFDKAGNIDYLKHLGMGPIWVSIFKEIF